jgi:1,4-alpha-glucan branching enzyme
MWVNAFSPSGYEWVSGDDTENCVLAYLRKGEAGDRMLLVICHFNTNAMAEYTVGVPYGGTWNEVLNSDDKKYGGSGVANGALKAQKKTSHGHDHSITFQLPPLCVMVFEGEDVPKSKGQGAKGKEQDGKEQAAKDKKQGAKDKGKEAKSKGQKGKG